LKKATFLDRDGVINRKAPRGLYVTRWEDMEFLPGVSEAIRRLHDAGFLIIVVSNQRCVAKGLIAVGELESVHERMRNHLAAAGATIDAIYYCPHEKEPPCTCRKPHPGMLYRAAHDHAVDLRASWMIGDSAHDVEAGRAAGCNTALIVDPKSHSEGSDVTASSLLDAAQKILQLEAPSRFFRVAGAVPNISRYRS
jgi:D-glycero-D-manno-heptose 1,7-bisphosphate phosphatase